MQNGIILITEKMPERSLNSKDAEVIIDKVFSVFDKDNSGRFSRSEFPQVMKSIINMLGAEECT